jgi:hypothetical protein
MMDTFTSPPDEIVSLKYRLALAEERLEQAQSFVFDLRCLAARKEGRGLWIREGDRSGMRAAVWIEEERLGPFSLIKVSSTSLHALLAVKSRTASAQHADRQVHSQPQLENLPLPVSCSLNTSAVALRTELVPSSGLFAPPSSSPFIPPELFYHLVEHTSPSTTASLCLVSSSIRAIASPQLYKTMIVSSPSQLAPFLLNPTPPDRSLTLDRVLSLDMSVDYGRIQGQQAVERRTYTPFPFPLLRHLFIRLKDDDLLEVEPEEMFNRTLSLASSFLSHLNPQSLSLSFESRLYPRWESIEFHQDTWREATSMWNRLESISYIDCHSLMLFHTSGDGGYRAYAPLLPSDLPGCTSPISFSFVITDRVGGYLAISTALKEDGLPNPVEEIIDELRPLDWPSLRELGIQLDVGDREENRAALEEDVQKLPEEWRLIVGRLES